MQTTIRTLSTGDVMVFDEQKRDLYIIDARHAKNFDDQKVKDAVSAAQAMVKAGHAHHFDRAALKTLQAALAGVKPLSV